MLRTFNLMWQVLKDGNSLVQIVISRNWPYVYCGSAWTVTGNFIFVLWTPVQWHVLKISWFIAFCLFFVSSLNKYTMHIQIDSKSCSPGVLLTLQFSCKWSTSLGIVLMWDRRVWICLLRPYLNMCIWPGCPLNECMLHLGKCAVLTTRVLLTLGWLPHHTFKDCESLGVTSGADCYMHNLIPLPCCRLLMLNASFCRILTMVY
jgi:hypothetical protein